MTTDDLKAGDAALLRCVSCPPAQFYEQVWARRPLLSRAAELSRPFTDLFGAGAVDALVATHGLRTPFARMALDGDVLPAARFTRGGGAGAGITDQLADDKVLTAMADGATLVLQGLHRTWPPLVEFASALAAELGHPVQINSYVTPPQNRGFSAHYDDHDVFVLQVAGRKHWTVHEPVIEAPLAEQPWQSRRDEVAARAEEQPVIDTVLEPGDALYLPRGTIHSAAALGEMSVHLTVGVFPVTRRDVLSHVVELLRQDPQLRTSLPAGVDLTDPAVLADQLTATLDALRAGLADVSVTDVADRIAASLTRRTRPAPVGPLAQLAAVDALDTATQVQVRAGLRARVHADGPRVRVTWLGRDVTVPEGAEDAVKLLLSGEPIRPADLAGLDDAGQLELVRSLLREGLLVTVGGADLSGSGARDAAAE